MYVNKSGNIKQLLTAWRYFKILTLIKLANVQTVFDPKQLNSHHCSSQQRPEGMKGAK